MRPNVFLLDLSVGEEDLLTAYWHYVLSVVPDLGQAFVDHIAERAGIPSSRFLGAIDHPIGDRSNHPDLLLRCSEYDLLFEHKLDSPLGPEQLERYVALAVQKGWKMALLAARRLEVADSVCQSPAFVCPRGVGVPPHFLWQDVHEILARSEAHLAREFREYLEALGLGRFDWAGLGNPFTDESAAEQLRSLYDTIEPLFITKGSSCRKRSNSLVYEVRRPFSPIHLLNLLPLRSVAEWDKRLWGPVMALSVYVRRDGNLEQRVLSPANGYVKGSTPRVFVTDTIPVPVPNYDRRLRLEREYYVPLDEVLRESMEVSKKHLVTFVGTAINHLQGRLELAVGETMPNKALHESAAGD